MARRAPKTKTEIKDLDGRLLLTVDAPSLKGANLTGAQLPRARFRGPNLTDADLSGANLAGATFLWGRLIRTNFTGADLSGASFRGVDTTDATFHGANFDGTEIEWWSHTMVAEIVRQAAGDDPDRLDLVELILHTCHHHAGFLQTGHPAIPWVYSLLRARADRTPMGAPACFVGGNPDEVLERLQRRVEERQRTGR